MTPPPPVVVQRFAGDASFVIQTDLTFANVRCFGEDLVVGGMNQHVQPYVAHLVRVGPNGEMTTIAVDPEIETAPSFDGSDSSNLIVAGESNEPFRSVIMAVRDGVWTGTTLFSQSAQIFETRLLDGKFASLVWEYDFSTMLNRMTVAFDTVAHPLERQVIFPTGATYTANTVWRSGETFFISGAKSEGGNPSAPILAMCAP
jgi:hypothetical protein